MSLAQRRRSASALVPRCRQDQWCQWGHAQPIHITRTDRWFVTALNRHVYNYREAGYRPHHAGYGYRVGNVDRDTYHGVYSIIALQEYDEMAYLRWKFEAWTRWVGHVTRHAPHAEGLSRITDVTFAHDKWLILMGDW